MQNETVNSLAFEMENPDIRAKARERLKGRWLKAALSTGGLTLAYQLLNLGLSALLINVFHMYNYSSAYGVTPTPEAYLLLVLFSLLIYPAITMGVVRYGLLIARGGEQPTLGACFFFFRRSYWKAIGLQIAIGFKAMLWMLPGFGIMLLALTTGGLNAYVVAVIGFFVALVPALMAMLRYTLIPYRFVDESDITIGEAIREGIDLMAGKKWKVFCLSFSISFLPTLLVLGLQQLVPVLKEFPWMYMLNALLWPVNIYWNVAAGIFYLHRRGEDVDATATEESATTQAE